MSKTFKEQTAPNFDVQRYMGTWNVIALIPTPFDSLNNPAENYSWNEKEQRIDVRYTFNAGSIKGPDVSIPQKAFVEPEQPSAWKIQFPLIPFKFDYLIHDINADYSEVVVGIPSHKYAWIMSRSTSMSADHLEQHKQKLASLGYDLSKLKFPSHSH